MVWLDLIGRPIPQLSLPLQRLRLHLPLQPRLPVPRFPKKAQEKPLARHRLLLGTGGRDPLADEQANDTDGDDEDDAEYDDNTSLLLGPVLTLGDVGDGLTGNQSVVDGRHFVDLVRGS